MPPIRVACLGASNFKQALLMENIHTALKPYKKMIKVMATGGASVESKDCQKSFFRQMDRLAPFEGKTIYILFVGQNRFEENFNLFLQKYKLAIQTLVEQVGKDNVTILLALPRGKPGENDPGFLAQQADKLAELGAELDSQRIHYLNIWEKLPEVLKKPGTLFNKKDLVHYSTPVKLYIQQMTALAIKQHLNG